MKEEEQEDGRITGNLYQDPLCTEEKGSRAGKAEESNSSLAERTIT